MRGLLLPVIYAKTDIRVRYWAQYCSVDYGSEVKLEDGILATIGRMLRS
jgi:hypothetical protein